MQLSLSPSPADSNLAAQLLGGEASGTAAFDGYSGPLAAPFAVLFPGLASATATATPPAPGKPGAALSAPAPWICSPRAPVVSPPNSISPTKGGSLIARTFPITAIATSTTATVVGTEGDEHCSEPDPRDGFSEECSDSGTSRREDKEAPCGGVDSIVGRVLPFLPIAPSELIVAWPLAASAPAPRVDTALVTDSAAEPTAFGASRRPTPPRAATSSASAAPDQAVPAQPARAFTRPGAVAAVGISAAVDSPRSPLVESTSAAFASSQAIPTALSSPVTPESPRDERFRDLAALPAPPGHANERRTFLQSKILSRPVPVARDPATRDDFAAPTVPRAPLAPDSGSVPSLTPAALNVSADSHAIGHPFVSRVIPLAAVVRSTPSDSQPLSGLPLQSHALSASGPFEFHPRQFSASGVAPALNVSPKAFPAGEFGAIPSTSFGAADEVGAIKFEQNSGAPFAPFAPRAFAPLDAVAPSVGDYSGPRITTAGAPLSPAPRASAGPAAPAPLPVVSEITVTGPTPAVSLPGAVTGTSLMSSGGAPFTSSPRALAARESAPISQGEKSSTTRGAKIAVPTGNVSAQENIDHSDFDKIFLNSSNERLVLPAAAVGTGVAKSDAPMSAATFFNRPAPTAVLDHAPVASWPVTPLAGSPDFPAPAGFGPETSATAQQAVEAVLTAAEQFTSREQQSVKLHFSVGGTDLSVRVELRANQVHATFHSDSPELNSALAHEWQGSALTHAWQGAALVHQWPSANGAEAGDRLPRFAPPAFTTGSHPSDESTLAGFAGGDGSSQQRGTGARSGDENAAGFGRSGRASSLAASGTATGTDSAASVVPTASRGTRPAASPRLSTHA